MVISNPSFPSAVAVVIPAWQPQPVLTAVVASLADFGCGAIVVVDDGSDAEHHFIFETIEILSGVTVVHLERNSGKGSALKAGFRKVLADFPEYSGVVTADADGQHAAEDITRVAATLAEHLQKLVMGARRPVPEMPLRSRFGNALTRHVFRLATGVTLADTQTGLRGFPKTLIPEILAVRGERYEYEMAVLLNLCSAGHLPVEVPIRTIYTEGNRSSHFRPVRDSAHVYRELARHCLARRMPWKHHGPAKRTNGKS